MIDCTRNKAIIGKNMELKKINKHYKNNHVLKDVSFTLKEGKTTAILGHNGAGKTTLIKCILNLIKYEGEIDYGFPKSEIYNNINVQMQTSAYEKNAKVIEICKLYKKILNVDVDINKMLKYFNLTKHKKSYANTLSGGEQQKLTILLTLLNNPKIIIYDELTTGLDVMARRDVWNILKDVQKEYGSTILITSHMLEEIEYLSDELIVLDHGEIKFEGNVEEFVAELYDGQKILNFKCSDAETIGKIAEKIGKELVNENGKFSVTISEAEEEEIILYLYSLDIKNVECRSFSFEDAFLKRFKYTLDKEETI